MASKSNNDNPLRPIVAKWLHKLKFAADYKARTFGDDARECMQFFNGPYDFIYGPMNRQNLGMVVNYDNVPSPTFRMSHNKVAEMVQLFGPVMYQKNPHRTITPRVHPTLPMPPAPPMPPLPPQLMNDPRAAQMMQMMQQQQAMQWQQQWQAMQDKDNQHNINSQLRAALLSQFLNYTPEELGMVYEVRGCIDEAIIKGAGVMWLELVEYPTGLRLPGHLYDTIDNFLMDPDAEKPDDCYWVARRCQHPVWAVEKEYGLKPGTLKANAESWDSVTEYDPDDFRRWKRQQGGTNDIITYWKIYSRMGIGGRLRDADLDYREALDSYGDNCFLVVADGVDYPLNVPPDVVASADDQEIQRRVQWPIRVDLAKMWPMEMIGFHTSPRQIWPVSHLKPALGQLKFLNWAYSFLATKMPTWGRNFLAMPKSLSEKNKTAIQSGKDLTILELDQMTPDVKNVLQMVTAGPIQPDFFKMIEMVSKDFEKAVGLLELLYGIQGKQMRSASEAQMKDEQVNVRPKDMQARLMVSLSSMATKEAIAAQMLMTPQDLEPILGVVGTWSWGQALSQCDINEIIHKLDFRVDADDTRVPDRQTLAQNMQQANTTLFTPMLQHATNTGDYKPINYLIQQWATSIDLEGKENLVLGPPPPPPPPPEPAPKVSVTLKGEDLAPLGIAAAIQQDFLQHNPPPQGQPPNPITASPPPAAPPG
jgi:hypothetical protein